MERWAKPTHRRGGRDNPSFSSSLLDAIYRSIDDPSIITSKNQLTSSASTMAAEKPVIRRKNEPTDFRHYRNQHYAPILTNTTSSSDSSSYCGFSSDADSSIFSSTRPKPIRTSAPEPEKPQSHLPPQPPDKKKSGSSSIRSRFRDLRKPKAGSAPASPGGRLASFLNSLFSGNGSPKKAKISSPAAKTAATPAAAAAGDESACSSATSFTRSCLSKTPTSGRKRTVRFGPVSVVATGDERRHSGRRSICDDRDPARARESRRMVEELLRELGASVGDYDDGAESDSSSDLFELEIPAVKGGGRRYIDELPVYETTHFATNRAIAQYGLVMY